MDDGLCSSLLISATYKIRGSVRTHNSEILVVYYTKIYYAIASVRFNLIYIFIDGLFICVECELVMVWG